MDGKNTPHQEKWLFLYKELFLKEFEEIHKYFT